MHTISLHCQTIQQMREQLLDTDPPDLIQFYTAMPAHEAYPWVRFLEVRFPDACRVGMSVAQQNCPGEVHTDGATLMLSYFPGSKLDPAAQWRVDPQSGVFWNGHLPVTTETVETLVWISRIRKALADNAVFPYMQPVFDSRTGRCVGAEALLRVRIGDQVLAPGSFLSQIKQTRLYPKLTESMLETCFGLLRQYPYMRLSLNLSILDFKHEATLELLQRRFREHGWMHRLTLEITESERIEDYDWLTPILQEFRASGAWLAIDDFGAGYSNLEKMIQLQPDVLKLDGSIIRTIDHDPKLRLLVRHFNDLAHSLNIRTLAEYVHSQPVMDVLTDIGVDYLQGYHLSPPVDANAWIRMATSVNTPRTMYSSA